MLKSSRVGYPSCAGGGMSHPGSELYPAGENKRSEFHSMGNS